MIQIIISLIFLFWTLLFAVARFWQYFRIYKYYCNKTVATVVSRSDHIPTRKKESPALDIKISYTLDGEEKTSEFVVSKDRIDEFREGASLNIRYYKAENGTVHIASGDDNAKKFMFAYGALIAIVFIGFIVLILI